MKIVTGTLREYVCTFMITSHSIPLRTSNTSDKICRESQNTSSVSLTFSEIRAVYELNVKNMLQPNRAKMTI